ncbi:hypothetical protein AVEN_256972-1 [Araneus ventricosus]|uniref:DUF5641 domain-containing protein n=1 Tax=Araneus ventricosus TaxID=182803 RepID=A0A4Y2ED34_ARAVE|nr:hypothetical protein AVEN_256972-1 [Araneus ventricosus]
MGPGVYHSHGFAPYILIMALIFEDILKKFRIWTDFRGIKVTENILDIYPSYLGFVEKVVGKAGSYNKRTAETYSRPLTYISENPQELIPLIPSIFLIENRLFGVADIDKIESQHLQYRIRCRVEFFNDLRHSFRKKYIGQLIQKRNVNKITQEPKVVEVALIDDDVKKWLDWPLALILELIPGPDSKVRTVKLKKIHGTVLRPIKRIFPLELDSRENFVKGLEEPIQDSVLILSPDEVIV